MARRGGWRRIGRKRFRYVGARGREVVDEEQLARIRALAIPPAWHDVWISPSPRAKLQATGVDSAGRKQYLYLAEHLGDGFTAKDFRTWGGTLRAATELEKHT